MVVVGISESNHIAVPLFIYLKQKLAIVLSAVLRFTASDYPFGIFTLVLENISNIHGCKNVGYFEAHK